MVEFAADAAPAPFRKFSKKDWTDEKSPGTVHVASGTSRP
jgi:hypothetical protein